MRSPSEIRKDWEAAIRGPWKPKLHVVKGHSAIVVDEFNNNIALCPEWYSTGQEFFHNRNAKAIANAPTDVIDLLDWVSKAIPHLKDYGQMLDSRIPGLDYIPDPDIAEEDKTINVISGLLKEIEG